MQETRAAMSPEEYVRENWERVEVHYYPAETAWKFFTDNELYMLPKQPTKERLYLSGEEFTRERMNQIEEIEEAIRLVSKDCDGCNQCPAWDRILALLNRELSSLQTGMKQRAQSAEGE